MQTFDSVLAIAVPTAFYAALDRGTVISGSDAASGLPGAFVPLVSDGVRRDILRMSRGISVVLLVMYVGSGLRACASLLTCLTLEQLHSISRMAPRWTGW